MGTVSQTKQGIINSFKAVKRDMIDLRKRINRDFMGIESLNRKTGSLATKREFYSYIENLDNRIGRMEDNAVNKRLLSKFREDIKERLADLKDRIDRRDDLKREIKDIGLLKNVVLDLDGSKMDKKEFRDASIALVEVGRRVAAIEGGKAEREDIGILKLRMIDLKKDIMENEAARKNLAEIRKIKNTIEKLDDKKLQKEKFDELKKNVDKIKANCITSGVLDSRLNRIITSTDHLKKIGKRVSDIDKDLDRFSEVLDSFMLKDDADDFKYRLEKVNEEKVDGKKFNAEVREIKDKLDSLAGKQEKLFSEINEIRKLKDKKLKKVKAAKKEKKKGKGRMGNVFDSLVDFFLEEKDNSGKK